MKEIGSVLNLKPGTVAFHKYNLMQALGVKSNAGLLQYAIKRHLISACPDAGPGASHFSGY